MASGRALILSDGKPGHVNQSIAFARHLGYAYEVCPVQFDSRLAKAASYCCDLLGFLNSNLLTVTPPVGPFSLIVSAGSETYYANKILAQNLGAKSVAIMLPKGYRYDFNLIVAQQHDRPPDRSNILSVPINLSYPEPQGFVTPESEEKIVSLIVGGDSSQTQITPERLREQVDTIMARFPDHRFWLTTSRRTPPAVEKMLRSFKFSFAVYYSERQINPIPDFLKYSDYVFLTADSSSMISEAVSFGAAAVEILPTALEIPERGKFGRFFRLLRQKGCIHLFDGNCGEARYKIELGEILQGAPL